MDSSSLFRVLMAATALLSITAALPSYEQQHQLSYHYQTQPYYASEEETTVEGGRQLAAEYQQRQQENCHYLCGKCGCRGYYCGDECICQGHQASDDNVKCIRYMKQQSQRMEYPFEVLVQGPAGRRYAREATDIDPQTMADYRANERSGRSVYSIYKPATGPVGKGGLMAVAEPSEDANVGSPIVSARNRLESARVAIRDRIRAVGGSILGSSHNPEVGAAHEGAEPIVGDAQQEPVVASPAAEHSDPQVAAPADPTVGSAHEGDGAVVGSSHGATSTTSSLSSLIKGIPRISAPSINWPSNFDWLKLGGSHQIITQPGH